MTTLLTGQDPSSVSHFSAEEARKPGQGIRSATSRLPKGKVFIVESFPLKAAESRRVGHGPYALGMDGCSRHPAAGASGAQVPFVPGQGSLQYRVIQKGAQLLRNPGALQDPTHSARHLHLPVHPQTLPPRSAPPPPRTGRRHDHTPMHLVCFNDPSLY